MVVVPYYECQRRVGLQVKNEDVTDAQVQLAIKAFDCIIGDIKMDAPLAGKVYDEIKAELGLA